MDQKDTVTLSLENYHELQDQIRDLQSQLEDYKKGCNLTLTENQLLPINKQKLLWFKPRFELTINLEELNKRLPEAYYPAAVERITYLRSTPNRKTTELRELIQEAEERLSHLPTPVSTLMEELIDEVHDYHNWLVARGLPQEGEV